MEHEVVIIGTGLFGSTIGRKLQAEGREVFFIDGNVEGSASKAAACLIKPGWIASLGKEVCANAMWTLQDLFDIHKLSFVTNKLVKVKVDWIDPKKILVEPDLQEKIVSISKDSKCLWVLNDKIKCRYLIIAAGVWCNEILKSLTKSYGVPGLAPRTGASFTASGKTQCQIAAWRPYRQLTAFEMYPNTIWVGDSEGYKEYGEDKLIKSQHRCADFIDLPPAELRPVVGHRPYVPDAKPCYLQEYSANLWVITGGAKNGTIAAGWAAYEIARLFGHD